MDNEGIAGVGGKVVALLRGAWRLGLAPGEQRYDELEKQLSTRPAITVPTITLEGDANGAPHPEANAYAEMSASADLTETCGFRVDSTTCPVHYGAGSAGWLVRRQHLPAD